VFFEQEVIYYRMEGQNAPFNLADLVPEDESDSSEYPDA
jgi:hypothetical protein